MENLKAFGFSLVFTAVILAVVIGGYIGVNAVRAVCSDDYYAWPKVTQCRVCEKTIWTWDDYERRKWGLEVDDSAMPTDSQLKLSGVSMSALFHKACKGTGPTTPPVKIEPVEKPQYH